VEPTVTDNPTEEQFEIHDGDRRAGFVAYEQQGRELLLLHTEVDPQFEGRGLGGRLARQVLDTARERGLEVLPYCPFIRGWIQRHPDYLDLVPTDRRSEFRL
jgi:uncharacterized protein